MVVALNDGTYIYNSTSAKEYLNSLGFDNFDIEELRNMLCGDAIEDAYNRGWQDCYKEDEIQIDGYFCGARDLAEAVDNLCDDFRKQYKSAAILKVLDAIKTCIRENRID